MAITSSPTYDPKNPFYSPGFNYGGAWGGGWRDDPLNTGYQVGEQNNAAAWTRRLAQMGYGGMDTKSAFLRSMFGRIQEGYGAAQMDAPGLYFQDYLSTITPDKLERSWLDASPSARGDTSAQLSPNVRWQRRP